MTPLLQEPSVTPKAYEAPVPNAGLRAPRSWGGYPRASAEQVIEPAWRDQLNRQLLARNPSSLPYGLGRSYGDSCLNDKGVLVVCRGLNRVLHFDTELGIITCEAGVSLAEILSLAVPKGWFLPVTPGTKFVTIAGAIANDVHGKNHHVEGTIGRHIAQLELVRSDRDPMICSPERNAEFFNATIGGMGLTGIITSATLRLKRIQSACLATETIPFNSLDQFLQLSMDDASWEYTVAWIDCLSTKGASGIFFRGNHSPDPGPLTTHPDSNRFDVPIALPEWALSKTTITVFNALYYRMQAFKTGSALQHYDPFFYPLDSVTNWNRIYGKRGLVQYQCVIPEHETQAFQQILDLISAAGQGSFLGVIKRFGHVTSPGIMSFPRPGLTLALDFPFRGEKTLKLFAMLDAIVLSTGGALYPAKDAHMSSEMFSASYPRLAEFRRFIDPHLSSSFWRRVAEGAA